MLTEEKLQSSIPKDEDHEDIFKDLMKNIHEAKQIIDFRKIESIETTFENKTSPLNAKIKNQFESTDKRKKSFTIDSEGSSFLNDWKLISVFPARITEINKTSILLEVILDEEVVEEQEYGLKFFEGYDLNSIKFFKIKCYERAREQRLVMTDASDSLKRDDFPSVDFSHITNSDIFF
ncbi:MAG: hypothetical protein OQJ96_00330 [Flavobacteriales bacterium]|nr:hypothetical protein [Flavobacteriales bacterium]MCW8912204.1 hypothetical protein [Flavobacteriales bacterium]MCW8938881.1 hypothetical protein [Flavobacteriales bacterium]MCW8939159.1 hypothetical protein [Flavobacteriales bacterium]MCW8967049.1 hypothetical protein [Flavobacteriales bacterium]